MALFRQYSWDRKRNKNRARFGTDRAPDPAATCAATPIGQEGGATLRPNGDGTTCPSHSCGGDNASILGKALRCDCSARPVATMTSDNVTVARVRELSQPHCLREAMSQLAIQQVCEPGGEAASWPDVGWLRRAQQLARPRLRVRVASHATSNMLHDNRQLLHGSA